MEAMYEDICQRNLDQPYEPIYPYEDIFGCCFPSSLSGDYSETESDNDKLTITMNEKAKYLSEYKKNNQMKRYIYKGRKITRDYHSSSLTNPRFHDCMTVYSPSKLVFHFNYPSIDVQQDLKETANKMVTCEKGILTTDESSGSLGKRLEDVGVPNSKENRHRYREILFTTDITISEYISGVTLNPETFYQKTTDGVPFIDIIQQRGILVGIKVDKGTVPLICSKDEFTTQGLDDLDYRCAVYKKNGCHYTKWRCVFKIGKNTPSIEALNDNTNVAARFSSISQAHGLVPIVEAKVLPYGNHGMSETQKVTEQVLAALCKALSDHHVFLEGILIKINVCTPGVKNPIRTTPEEIATTTVTALQRTVPPAVAGILVSSGGQSEDAATINLNAISKISDRKPWPLTFSYGRVLQASVLRTWMGIKNNILSAQEELLKQAMNNSLASVGKYDSAVQ